MSAPSWKPGDVAMVVNTAGENKVACFTGRWGKEAKEHWSFADGSTLSPPEVKDARPLVVIDPEDREQVERLTKALIEACFKHGNLTVAHNGIHGDTTEAALRSFMSPPGCQASITIGGVLIECERDNDAHLTDHRNDSIGQGIRWGA